MTSLEKLREIHDKYHNAHSSLDQELNEMIAALKYNKCMDCGVLISLRAIRCAVCSDKHKEELKRSYR